MKLLNENKAQPKSRARNMKQLIEEADVPVKYSIRNRRFSMAKALVISGIIIVLLALGLADALQRLAGG